MRTTILNNERGGMAALLSVIVLSMIMVSTLTSFYTYLENRARFQERIRMNYQMGYVIEDMSRALVDAREQFQRDPNCTGSAVRWIDCAQVCASSIAGLNVPPQTPPFAICVKNDNLNKVVNNADYFCTYNTEGGNGVNPPSYCGALVASNDSDLTDATAVAMNDQGTTINKWYSRLDKFFDTTIVKNAPVLAGKMYPVLEAKIQPPTLLGWMLPDKAVAAANPPAYPPTGGTDPIDEDCSSNPEHESCASQCSSQITQRPAFCKNVLAKTTLRLIDNNGCSASSTDPRCKRCGGNERISGACMKVSVCPPWIPARDCTAQGSGNSGGGDKRIHQMVRVATTATTTPPVVPPSAPPSWGSCPDECLAYDGPSCVSSPVQGGCRVACSGNGIIYYLCR